MQTLFGVPLSKLQIQMVETSYADHFSLWLLIAAQAGLALGLLQGSITLIGAKFFFANMTVGALLMGVLDVLRICDVLSFWGYVNIRRYGFRFLLAVGAWGNVFIAYFFH